MLNDTAPTVPPRKSRRWLRRFAILLALVLVLVWFAPTILARTGFLNSTIAKATGKLNGTFRVGGASLGWFSPVVLYNVTLTDAEGRTVLTAPTVRSSRSLMALARGQADLGTFTLEGPRLEVVCDGPTTNLERVLANYLNDDTPGGPRPVVTVAVTDGSLTLRDAEKSWVANDVDATVVLPPGTDAMTIDLKGKLEGTPDGRFEADVTTGTTTTVKLRTTKFPLEMVAPVARRMEPGLTTAGRLTADLDCTIVRGEHVSAKVAGSVAVADLEVGSSRLGAERFKLQAVQLPCRIETTPAGVKVEQAELTCDLGKASVVGLFDPNEPFDRWLDRAGLSATAELDVAKLAAMFPKLLRLREGTALTEGRVTARLASKAGPKGTVWDGGLSTSALWGTRDGKPLGWEQPVTVAFAGRLTPEKRPAFDTLSLRAEFATLTGSGTLDNFTLAGDASLDALTRRLGDFVDLSGVQLAGTAKLSVVGRTTDGASNVNGSLRLTNFDFAAGPRRLHEPDLTASFNADGRFFETAPRLDRGNVKVTAGGETAELRLLAPVADLRAVATGRAAATVTGDLARWIGRAAPFVTLPKGLQIGGRGTLAGNVTISPEAFAFDQLTADLKDAKFLGYGLTLDEPQLLVNPTNGTFHRQTGLVEFPTLVLQTPTVAASVKPLKLLPLPDGGYGVELEGFANASLSRLQKALGLQTDPQLSDRIDGVVVNGQIKVKTVGTAYQFEATLPTQKFVLGHPQRPAWAEEKLNLVAKGSYDLAGNNLQLDRGLVERPDGLKVELAGRVNQVTTVIDVDVSGKLTYDLAVIEPELKRYLGKSFQATGKDTRDFRLAGKLSSPDGLTGNASLAWQSLKAYGFDVGPSQLVAKLDKGVVALDPLQAKFGETGTVKLEPTVRFLPTGNELTFAKGKVIEQAKLTPAACADAIGYVLPAFAKSTQTQGTISFDLEDNRIPLADPEKAVLKGKLTLHEVQVGPGSVLAEVAQLLGAKNTLFSLNKDNKPQVVPIRFENGWVHHENLTLSTKNFTMITSGAVSVNGELNMVADVPLPEQVGTGLLKNNPKLRDALANRRVKLPIRGTINKPQLDPRAFQTAVKQVTEDVMKDVLKDSGKNALGGFFDKIAPPKKE